jgi:hypothetical protein
MKNPGLMGMRSISSGRQADQFLKHGQVRLTKKGVEFVGRPLKDILKGPYERGETPRTWGISYREEGCNKGRGGFGRHRPQCGG